MSPKGQELAQRLAQSQVNDGGDWLAFAPQAARLAAMGDGSQLERAVVLVRQHRIPAEKFIVAGCQKGRRKLEEAQGRDLAAAILDAQDFFCFLLFADESDPKWAGLKEMVTPEVRTQLEVLTEDANNSPLDDDAVEALEEFGRQWDLPEDYRLAVVACPLTEWQMGLALAARHSSPPQQVQIKPLPSGNAVLTDFQNVLAAYSGSPTDGLMQTVARDGTIELCHCRYNFVRRLHDNWQVVFEIEDDSGQPPPISSARIGRLVALPDESDPAAWIVDMSRATPNERQSALEGGLSLVMTNGERFTVNDQRLDSTNL